MNDNRKWDVTGVVITVIFALIILGIIATIITVWVEDVICNANFDSYQQEYYAFLNKYCPHWDAVFNDKCLTYEKFMTIAHRDIWHNKKTLDFWSVITGVLAGVFGLFCMIGIPIIAAENGYA